MRDLPVFVVDAFSGEIGGRQLLGNPAAVVLLSGEQNELRDDAWRQRVAAEMNHSETAFVVARADGDFDLRWFTPEVEVDLCGHATLAAAHVLWESGGLPEPETARFQTRSGLLTAARDGELIELDFPAQDLTEITAPQELLRALDLLPEISAQGVHRASDDWLIQMNRVRLGELKPEFGLLRKVCLEHGVRGVIATAEPNSQEVEEGIDFVSRFFGPAVGIDEDPVTGSAHTKLAPFWRQFRGKSEMWGYQESLRGGLVRVRVRQDRVLLGGRAITTLRGTLLI